MLHAALRLLSSLRLTVVLLALGIVLVFFGTLGQVSDGLYVAQERYFRSWFTYWNPVEKPWLRIPLPGGYLLGTLLVINLVLAHLHRFKMTWKKSGIFLTHIGVLTLLLGQLATDMLSIESQMSFREGEARNFTEDFHKHELAFFKPVGDTNRDRVITIPDSLLLNKEIQHEALPVRLRVRDFYENADVLRFAPRVHTNRTPASSEGMGARLVLEPMAPTREMDKRNFPAAVIELTEVASGDSLGTWLVSALLRPDAIEVNGEAWQIELRPTRYYHPFQITLLKTTHEKYLGTEIPRHFQSRVRIDNPETGERREVDIYMNNPLRYAGLTFYQHQMGREAVEGSSRGTSSLQVVRNPSWLTPYLGCILVGLGLTVQFSIHLGGFLRGRFGSGTLPRGKGTTARQAAKSKSDAKPGEASVGSPVQQDAARSGGGGEGGVRQKVGTGAEEVSR